MSGINETTQALASNWSIRNRLGILSATWLHALLFLFTLVTSTTFGDALYNSFRNNRILSLQSMEDSYVRLFRFDRSIAEGLWFSVPLLLILLAHEMGHYLECRRRQVDASLPYFLPSPSLFGTFGAFIRIRSPIYTREALFDIGIKGPLAGFLMLLPIFVIGISLSKAGPAFPGQDSVVFGTPLLFRVVERVLFPGVSASRILLHPLAVAAWAGLFATALNLLPIGQLDGGHITYALSSERFHARVGLVFLLCLVAAGFFYWPWWLWAVVMFLFGRRHPLVYDDAPLDRGRKWLCILALVIFLLSVTLVPVRSF